MDFPERPPAEYAYETTTDEYYADMQDDWKLINSEDKYPSTEGRLTVSSSVTLSSEKEQCLELSKTRSSSANGCLMNPNNCINGISISLWLRARFHESYLPTEEEEDLKDLPKQYILSTGGDMLGRTGIAVYSQGSDIHVVVSTGSLFWHVSVAGPIQNNTWTTFAFRWKKEHGIEIYALETFDRKNSIASVSKTIHSSESQKETAISSGKIYVGCHKTGDSENFSGFLDADVSDFAIWHRRVEDDELIFFLGDYTEGFNPDVSELSEMASRMDTSNADNFEFMVYMMKKMDRYQTNEEYTSETTRAKRSANGAEDEDSDQETESTTTSTEDEYDKFLERHKIVNFMMEQIDTKADISVDDFKTFLSATFLVSNIMKPELLTFWQNITLEPDGEGPHVMVENFHRFVRDLIARLTHENENINQKFSTVENNIVLEQEKATRSNYLNSRQTKISVWPDYSKEDLRPTFEVWNAVNDKVAVPIAAFGEYEEEKCGRSNFTFTYSLFNTYSTIAPSFISEVALEADRDYKVDSRVISVYIDTDNPECVLSDLQNHPIRFQLDHLSDEETFDQATQELKKWRINFQKRVCVYWDANVGDEGLWSSYECKMVRTNATQSLCACAKHGTFAVLAEKIENRVWPDEPDYLVYVTTIAYGISIALLVVLIFAICTINRFHEELFLVILNLCISLVLGMCFSLLADCNDVQKDYNWCMAIGVLLEYSYLSATVWVACLGYSAFRIIVKGIVEGKLHGYLFLGWGFPLIILGVSFILHYDDLGSDPRCFIGWPDKVKMVFYTAVLPLNTCNFICALAIAFNITRPPMKSPSLYDEYQSVCQGLWIAMLWFDLTWFFGLLAHIRAIHENLGDEDFYPFFETFNSFTGIVLFFCIGIKSSRFQLFCMKNKTQLKLMKRMKQDSVKTLMSN